MKRSTNLRVLGPSASQFRHRDAYVVGVGIQQEHQPGKARLGRGLELQLRV